MRLGAPVFVDSGDPEEWVQAHVAKGYGAAYCPPVSLDDPAGIRAFRKACDAAGLVIAEVGAWGNIIIPNEELRKQRLEHVRRQLALADEIGALGCVDFAGSFASDDSLNYHPKNFTQEGFDFIVETVQGILREVKPKRAKFMLETMQWIPPDSVDSYVALVEAIDDPMFGAHFDPTNLIASPRCYADTGAIIRDFCERLGDKIVSAHAKDLHHGKGYIVEMYEVLPGTGQLDYRAFVGGLAGLEQDVPLMIEHLSTEAEYDQAAAHIRSVSDELGVSF